MPGLRGGIRSNSWITTEDTITHNQYTLNMPENNEPEEDDALEGMIQKALNQTHSQFFFLNSIPKNKTMTVLSMLKSGDWINDKDAETIFFKLNVFNPNVKRLAQVLIIWNRAKTGRLNTYVLTSTAPDDGFYPDLNSADLEDELRWFFELGCLLFIICYSVVSVFNLLTKRVRFLDLITSLEFFCVCAMVYHFFVWLVIQRADDDYRNKIAAAYKNVDIAPDEAYSAKAILKSLYQGCDDSRLCPGTVFGILNGTAPYRFTFIRSAILGLMLLCLLVFSRIPPHSRLALLPNIMRRSAPEIGLIGLLLVLLFFVYAIVGTLLFGHLLPYFSSLFNSFQTNIEMALGADMDIMDMAKGFIDIPSASEGVSIIPLALLPVMYKWSLMILMTFGTFHSHKNTN
jgi:hypothetical protein